MKKLVLTLVLTIAFSNAALSHEDHDHSQEHKQAKDEKITRVPAAIKAAFPGAASVTLKHKPLNINQQAEIKKMAGVNALATDFQVYIAYGNKNGKKSQLGAATIIKPAANQQFVVIYDNKLNVKKVIAVPGSGEFATAAFLSQFAGKNHDSKFKISQDLKYSGKNKADAEKVIKAIELDVHTMQAVYGKPHHH